MTEGMSPEGEHQVKVQPRNVVFMARHGESVFDAARRNGILWPTRCFGRGACRQCYFEISASAMQALSALNDVEEEALRRGLTEPLPGLHTRLGCQAKVLSDVEVIRAGVRDAPDRVQKI